QRQRGQHHVPRELRGEAPRPTRRPGWLGGPDGLERRVGLGGRGVRERGVAEGGVAEGGVVSRHSAPASTASSTGTPPPRRSARTARATATPARRGCARRGGRRS